MFQSVARPGASRLVFWILFLLVPLLACLNLATAAPRANSRGFGPGGFTPTKKVTISFLRSTYFVGTQATATVSLSGPSGTYSVVVTGPGTSTSVSLTVGGAPGANSADVNVNIPTTAGNATYTATANDWGVSDSATVRAEAKKHDLEVTLTASPVGSITVGDTATSDLEVEVDGEPNTQQQTQIVGPTYGWSVVKTEFKSKASDNWAAAESYYSTPTINSTDGEPNATLITQLLRKGLWKLTVKVTVSYDDPVTTANWYGEDETEVEIGASLNATIKVKRNSTTTYSNSAIVAAGAVDASEHKADVEIAVKNSNSEPVSGAYVGDLIVTSAGQDTTGTTNSSVALSSNSTNEAGKIGGTFLSGNRVETTHLEVDATQGGTNPKVMVNQNWNELKGSEDAWEYSSYFIPGQGEPITYKMSVDGNVPISGHELTFSTTKLTGLEWQPDVEVDEDDDGVVDYMGVYVEDVDYEADDEGQIGPDGIYTDLVTYSPTQKGVGDSLGKYTSTQTINDYVGPEGYIDYYVDAVDFDVVDGTTVEPVFE